MGPARSLQVTVWGVHLAIWSGRRLWQRVCRAHSPSVLSVPGRPVLAAPPLLEGQVVRDPAPCRRWRLLSAGEPAGREQRIDPGLGDGGDVVSPEGPGISQPRLGQSAPAPSHVRQPAPKATSNCARQMRKSRVLTRYCPVPPKAACHVLAVNASDSPSQRHLLGRPLSSPSPGCRNANIAT